MSFHKLKNLRSKKYLEYIRELPCAATNGFDDVVAHHVRCLGGGGTGIKPSDYLCVPLTAEEHAKLHSLGEKRYWLSHGLIPEEIICQCLLGYFSEEFSQDTDKLIGLIDLIQPRD